MVRTSRFESTDGKSKLELRATLPAARRGACAGTRRCRRHGWCEGRRTTRSPCDRRCRACRSHASPWRIRSRPIRQGPRRRRAPAIICSDEENEVDSDPPVNASKTHVKKTGNSREVGLESEEENEDEEYDEEDNNDDDDDLHQLEATDVKRKLQSEVCFHFVVFVLLLRLIPLPILFFSTACSMGGC